MRNMIFVTGFARGGTSWLRDRIGSHSNVQILPGERTEFGEFSDFGDIRPHFEKEVAAAGLDPTKL